MESNSPIFVQADIIATYQCAQFLRVVALIFPAVVLFPLLPFLLSGRNVPIEMFVAVCGVILFIGSAALYIIRYKITLTNHYLIIRTYKSRKFDYEDIESFYLDTESRYFDCAFFTRDGRRVEINSMVKNFPELVERLSKFISCISDQSINELKYEWGQRKG